METKKEIKVGEMEDFISQLVEIGMLPEEYKSEVVGQGLRNFKACGYEVKK